MSSAPRSLSIVTRPSASAMEKPIGALASTSVRKDRST
jgi:hypothetical protein